MEKQARERARAEAEEVQARLAERAQTEADTGKKVGGRPPVAPDPETAKPDPKSRRNFTDPDARISKDGATKAFAQAYNAQAAADSAHQIIVAADVTQQGNDKQQLVPMMAQVAVNRGRLPENTSADAGYYSESAVTDPSLATTALHVPPERHKHPEPLGCPQETGPAPTTKAAMQRKLASPAGQAIYRQRKAIIEPAFGQIKHNRWFR